MRVSLVALLLVLSRTVAAAPVAVYPLEAKGGKAEDLAFVQLVLESALVRAANQGVDLTANQPLRLQPSCGATPVTTCLTGVAPSALVLFGSVAFSGSAARLELSIASAGQITSPERFTMSLAIEDQRAVQSVLRKLLARAPRPDAAPLSEVLFLRPPSTALATTSAERPLSGVARTTAPAEAGSHWQTVAGWPAVVAGAVALAAGLGIGLYDRSVSARLQSAYERGTLRHEDKADYALVQTLNRAANGCFVAGGLFAAGGTHLLVTAPEGSPQVGVGFARRF